MLFGNVDDWTTTESWNWDTIEADGKLLHSTALITPLLENIDAAE